MGPTTSGIGMDRTAGELNELIDALEELVQELAGRLARSRNTLAGVHVRPNLTSSSVVATPHVD